MKTASKLFEQKGYYWETVLEAFESKDMTETDALLNARLAKILQASDYDFINRRPIPWNPAPADYKVDVRAGVPTEESGSSIE